MAAVNEAAIAAADPAATVIADGARAGADRHISRSSVAATASAAHTHAYMHTCIHAHMHICIHAYMRRCMHAYMRVCMHACTHACMHVCMHAHMHVHIHVYVHMHTCTCTCACIHACMYVCMYVDRHLQRLDGDVCMYVRRQTPAETRWGAASLDFMFGKIVYLYREVPRRRVLHCRQLGS